MKKYIVLLTIIKSPIVVDKFVTNVKEDPNSCPGISKETGFPGSKITMSSVVVGPFGVVDISHAKPLEWGP